MVAVTVAVADLEGCVLIRLVCTVMHWIGRDESDNVGDKCMIMKLLHIPFWCSLRTPQPWISPMTMAENIPSLQLGCESSSQERATRDGQTGH